MKRLCLGILMITLAGAARPLGAQTPEASAEPSAPESVASEKYTDPEGRFSLLLPVGWQVNVDLFGVIPIRVGPEDPGGPRVYLGVRPGQGEGDLAALVQEGVADVFRDAGQPTVRNEGPLGAEGQCYRARLEFQREGEAWRAVAATIRKADGSLGFACAAARADDFTQARPAFIQVIGSFFASLGFDSPPDWAEVLAEEETADAYERYVDPSGRWSVVVPRGWVVRMLPGRLLVAAESETANAFALLTLRRDRDLSAARDGVGKFVPLLQRVMEHVEPVGEGQQVSQQPDVYVQEFAIQNADTACRGELTIQRRPDTPQVLYAYAQAEEDRYEDMLPILHRVLSSFRSEAEGREARETAD